MYKRQPLLGWCISLQAEMLTIRFVYLVVAITVVIAESNSDLDGATELRVAHQAALFGLTDEKGNEYIEYMLYTMIYSSLNIF